MNIKRRPTQADVARLAGVSRSTVSIVMRGASSGLIPIADETRQKVLEAARQLNYAPDPVAQMLVTGSNNLIGVFTYEMAFPVDRSDFYYDFLLGIEREAGKHDFNVILFTRQNLTTTRRIFASGSNALRLADGSILLGAQPDREELSRMQEEGYPFVFIGRREVPNTEIDWVASDYTPASKQAIEHLLNLGHRKLALFATDLGSESSVDKLEGVNQAISGYPGAELHILPDASIVDDQQLVDALLASGASALVCSHTPTFNQGIRAIKKAGFDIPQDFSILSLAAAAVTEDCPVLPTHIAINRQKIGQLAVRHLVRLLQEEEAAPQQERVPCIFVPGRTTAEVPAPAPAQ